MTSNLASFSLRPLLVAVACAGLMLGACGDDDGGGSTTGGQPTGEAMTLEPNELEQVDSSAVDGHLALVWFQVSDDGPDPDPQIASQAPFNATTTSIELELSTVDTPGDPVLMCNRRCDDESQCACEPGGPLKFGLGLVVVVEDADGSGKIEPGEFSDENIFGIGRTVVAWSPARVPDADNTDFFDTDLLAGIHAYSVIEDPNETFDTLGEAPTDTTFELAICPPDSTTCELPWPNLS